MAKVTGFYGGKNIELNKKFDWPEYKANAAKDILCAMVSGLYATGDPAPDAQALVKRAMGLADELVRQLKNKED